MLVRVFGHDALFHLHRVGHHAAQLVEVGRKYVEGNKLPPHLLVAYQPMLQHLGIARADVVAVERLQKHRVENYVVGIAEHSNLVFQSIEVDARLSAHRRIDHREQRGGNVDEPHASLERRGGKSAKVGHHAAAKVYYERLACHAIAS